MEINWQEPKGRYEDNYGQFIEFFAYVAAHSDDPLIVVGTPWSWVPLLTFLRCHVKSAVKRFEHCHFVANAISRGLTTHGMVDTIPMDRTILEVMCGFRPELAEALYRIDVGQIRRSPQRTSLFERRGEFIVTTNGSFFREEVLDYIRFLRSYTPPILAARDGRTQRKVLLVPCAADKPYPAPLHAACLALLPPEYYMACATGVLGIVPQDLWPVMPHYDSGIPNQWRLYEVLTEYFTRHEHDRIVVYCDFYAHVIAEVMHATGLQGKATFVLGTGQYDDYVNLLSTKNLALLSQALAE